LEKKDDKYIISQIRQGNKAVFNDLFRNHYQALCRFSFHITGSKDDAEEAVQTVFTSFWKNRKNKEISISINAYFYSSVRNASYNIMKKKNAREINEQIAAEPSIHETQENNPKINKKKFNIFFKRALEELPEKCRSIFVLSRQEGLSYSEIAEYLQISNKTVESQMGIAYKKLRSSLKPKLKEIMSGN